MEEGILYVNQSGNSSTGGTLTSTSSITVKQGGTFRINNGNASNYSGNRVNDAAVINLAGGAFTYASNNTTGVNYSETVGTLNLSADAVCSPRSRRMRTIPPRLPLPALAPGQRARR